jgi:hypothetical protein
VVKVSRMTTRTDHCINSHCLLASCRLFVIANAEKCAGKGAGIALHRKTEIICPLTLSSA